MRDVSDAILSEHAKPGKPAKYRTREEQEVRLQAMFEKWQATGKVWSAAAMQVSRLTESTQYYIQALIPLLIDAQVHADQLRHVKKGCLTRAREDIAADGSRIEGSHKEWNTIQQHHASGIEMFKALAHDFVLRWNIRATMKAADAKSAPANAKFILSTFGCHHLRLCNAVNLLFNTLVERERSRGIEKTYHHRATFKTVNTGETFGLIVSANSITFNGLYQIKEEPEVEEQLIQMIDEPDLGLNADTVIPRPLKIEPALFSQRLISNVASSSQTASSTLAHLPPVTALADSMPDRPHAAKITASTAVQPSTSSPSLTTIDVADPSLPPTTTSTSSPPSSSRPAIVDTVSTIFSGSSSSALQVSSSFDTDDESIRVCKQAAVTVKSASQPEQGPTTPTAAIQITTVASASDQQTIIVSPTIACCLVLYSLGC